MHEGTSKEGGITYEVAEVLRYASSDLTHGFLVSRYGQEVVRRCGISMDELKEYVSTPKEVIGPDGLAVPEHSFPDFGERGPVCIRK